MKIGHSNISHHSFTSARTSIVAGVGCLSYQCNICGRACQEKVVELGREKPSCPNCGSTVRMRAIIYLLSMELLGKSLALPDFPVRPDIRGIGMSDWAGYAGPLAHKLTYANTYYHQEPKLDITAPVDLSLEGTLDFLVSSDVFEHIAPPVSIGFENAYRLLKPGGVFILTQKFPDSCFGAWLGGPDWRNRPEPGKFSSNYVQLASCFGTCVPNLTLLDNNRETFVNSALYKGRGNYSGALS